MHPENKKFLRDVFDKFPVSVMRHDDAVLYYISLPDDRKVALCAETTLIAPGNALIYYTATLDDNIMEEATVDTTEKQIDPIARDIIQLMRMCSTKIMMQEAHLKHSKYMIHEITNNKSYS